MKAKYLIIFFISSIILIIFFWSPGSKSSLKNEVLVLLDKTSYPYEDHGKANTLSNLLNDLTNIDFYKSDNNSFPKIYLNIKFKDFDTLLDSRKKSLNLHKSAQYLIEKKRVPAELIYKEKKYKTRIRLKGDRATHWIDNKLFSIDIKIKDGSIDGWDRIALQSHSARGFPSSLLLSNMIKRLGIITENYRTYELYVNGEYWGKRYAIDRISESFFENRKLKESITFKFSDEEDALIAAKLTSNYIPIESLNKILFSQGKYITKFDDEEKITNLYLKSVIKSLNYSKFDDENYVRKKLFFQNIFELDEIAIAYAYIFLFIDSHPFGPRNLILYFDPYLGKIRPILTDIGGSNISNNYSSENLNFKFIKHINNNLAFLLTDENFFNKIINKMTLIINEFENVEKDIEKIEKKYNKKFENIIPFETINQNYKNFTKDKKNYYTKIKNVFLSRGKLDLEYINQEYLKLKSNNKNFNIILNENYKNRIYTRVYDDGGIEIKNLTNEKITLDKLIVKGSNKICNKKIQFNLIIEPNSAVTKKTNLIDCIDSIYEFFFHNEINKYTHKDKIEDHRTRFNNLINKDRESLFYRKNVKINAGKTIIDKPLRLKNADLIIDKNSNILIKKGSFILIENGNLVVNGTEAMPVTIEAFDDNWGGIYIKNSKNSKITNLNIKNINYFNDYENLYFLTGAVNFYNSNIEISSLNLKNSMAEDGINFVNSSVKLKNIKINNTISDAIDFDFSDGKIENIIASNIKGDALDFAGSNFDISNSNFRNIFDKAISVGERSNININNIKVKNSDIGIAVKDGSFTNLTKYSFLENKNDISAYLKKPFYEIGGKINIYGGSKSLSIYSDELSEIEFYD